MTRSLAEPINLLTAIWSWYSDMSRRTKWSLLPKTLIANCLASSVLPTPVGPVRRNEPVVFNALLQIMDDGRLTDAQGRTVSFKDTILIMTSNAGFSDKLLKDGKVDQDKLISALENYFRPEFLNRLDAIVPFWTN